jgi:hypothetical protein
VHETIGEPFHRGVPASKEIGATLFSEHGFAGPIRENTTGAEIGDMDSVFFSQNG